MSITIREVGPLDRDAFIKDNLFMDKNEFVIKWALHIIINLDENGKDLFSDQTKEILKGYDKAEPIRKERAENIKEICERFL